MTTTTAQLPGVVDGVRGERATKPIRSLGTLTKRRLALTVRSPRSFVLPLVAPALFALVIAPALANTIHPGPGRTAYMTFVALSTLGLLIPMNCLFSGLGVIVDRQVGPGQYAQAGASTPAFTIADLSSVWLIANVREADASHVQRGQNVEVHVLAYPDRTFTARVIYVAPTIDPNTHRLTVRAVIDNADSALKPEMFANFRIVTSEGAESPAVPESAVVYEGASAHVWVLQSGNAIAIRPIRVGRSNDGYVEVLDGLKSGERVVTKGSLFIDRAAAG